MKDVNAIASVLTILAGLFFAAVMAFKFAETESRNYAGYQQHKAMSKQYMKDQNCKVSGYYGRHGEHKIYTCDDGKVWRESEL